MSDVHLMLQENILRFKDADNVCAIFDLKGSSVNREVKGNNLKATTTLKDVNLRHLMKKEPEFVAFGDLDNIQLMRSLRKDVKFLQSMGIMDYSLLLGIEKTVRDLDNDAFH